MPSNFPPSHKDDDGSKILKAVEAMGIRSRRASSRSPISLASPRRSTAALDLITMVWGKKHFDERFASFRENQENWKMGYDKDPNVVVHAAIGAVLRHMDFHTGNPIIAKAYEDWKAFVGAGIPTRPSFRPTASSSSRISSASRSSPTSIAQDPTKFDELMAGDAAIGITILEQFLRAQALGYNTRPSCTAPVPTRTG